MESVSEKIASAHDRPRLHSVLRSQSFHNSEHVEDEFDNENDFHSNHLSANSDVNANPEGFVVLNGQAIRVQRKTLKLHGQPLSNSFDSLESTLTANVGIAHARNHGTDEPSSAYLKQALENSSTIIVRQQTELSECKSRIEELERYISSLNLPEQELTRICIKKSDTASSKAVTTLEVDPMEKSQGTVTTVESDANYITPKNGSVPPTRRKFFPSPESNTSESPGDVLVIPCDDTSTTTKKKAPPAHLMARLALGSSDRRKLGTGSAASSPSVSTGVKQSILNRHIDPNAPPLDILTLQNVESPTVSECGSAVTTGTAATSAVAGGSQQRRPVKGRKTFRSESPTVPDSPAVGYTAGLEGVPSTPKALFNWKQRIQQAVKSGSRAPHCIFIAHDNPQLSKTIDLQLQSGVSKGGMQIMLESKGRNDLTHFMVGDIIYSGDYAHVQDASLENSRGSECLIATNLKAVRHPIKQFQTRTSPSNKDIVEINMVDLPAGSIVDVSTTEGVTDFLSSCKARVDCILDPYQSYNTWYPYYETGGSRKMAPQFRSQGIGYIRLGDDMSNYGIAFISLDAGATYLDNGATNIVGTPTAAAAAAMAETRSAKLNATFSALGSALTENKILLSSTDNLALALKSASATAAAADVNADSAQSSGTLSKKNSVRNIRSLVRTASMDNDESMPVNFPSSSGGGGSVKATTPKHGDFSALPRPEAFLELLSSLKDSAVKWQQRTQLLNSLCSLLNTINSYFLSTSSNICTVESYLTKNSNLTTDLLSVLLDHILKQKNPLTVVATLNCVGCFSFGELLAAHFSVFWRQLLVESLHLLRSNNKQVFEAAQGMANSLYQLRAVTFAYLSNGVLADVLAGPKSSGAAAAAAANGSQGGANIARVLQWMEFCAKVDLQECLQHHSRAESDSSALSGATAFKNNAVTLVRKLIPLLTHREEAARDRATSLLSHYLVLHVMFGYSQYSSFLRTADGVQTSSASATSELYKHLGEESLVELLKGIEKTIPRSLEKVVQSVWSLASESSQTLQMMKDQLNEQQLEHSKGAANAPKTPRLQQQQQSPPAAATEPVAPPSEVKNMDMQSALGLLRANSKTGLTRSNSRKLRRSNDEVPGSSNSLLSNASGVHSSPSASDVTDSEFTPRLSSASPDDSVTRSSRSGKVSPRASLQVARQNDLQYGRPLTGDKLANKMTELSNSWYEVQLLLKSSPSSEKQWNELCSVVKNSKDLFPSVIQLAGSVNTPVGTILRAILPFDENTSSNNQAAIGQAASETFGTLPSHLLHNTSVVSQLSHLRALVVDFRRMIRVKIADEADMKQAMVASQMLNKFVESVEWVAESRRQSVSEVVSLLV